MNRGSAHREVFILGSLPLSSRDDGVMGGKQQVVKVLDKVQLSLI
jgi:hypothetical protein